MFLNDLKPDNNAKKTAVRLGRGIGSGKGKTCGRGHKGQRARAGGYHKVGFEGGQMPLQRRLPKFGFRSAQAKRVAEVRLHELLQVGETTIDFAALRLSSVINAAIARVKIIASGKLDKAVTIKCGTNIALTKGAKAAILAVGGSIEE